MRVGGRFEVLNANKRRVELGMVPGSFGPVQGSFGLVWAPRYG